MTELIGKDAWAPRVDLRDPKPVDSSIESLIMHLIPSVCGPIMYSGHAKLDTGRTCVVGDMVMFLECGERSAGEIIAHFSSSDVQCCSIVRRWTAVRRCHLSYKCTDLGAAAVVLTAAIMDCLVFSKGVSAARVCMLSTE